MINYIKKLDLFGSSYKFTVNREKRFQSVYGGITSILVTILFMIFFIYRLLSFSRQENVKKEYYIRSHTSARINLNSYGKFMVITCISATQNFTSIDHFAEAALEHKFRFSEVYRRPWLIENHQYIEVKKCEFKDFPTGYISPPLFKKYQHCKCIPHTSVKKFIIRNFWTKEYYSNLEYYVKFKEEVWKDKEKHEKIQNYFRRYNPRIVTFFYENDVNIETLGKPIMHNLNLNTDYLNIDFTQKTDIFLKTIRYDKNIGHSYQCKMLT